MAGNNPTLYAFVKNVNTEIDVFWLSSCLDRHNQDVYALYDSEEAYLAGEKPSYVGISQDAVVRLEDHKKDRFVEGNYMHIHHEQIPYAQARAIE